MKNTKKILMLGVGILILITFVSGIYAKDYILVCLKEGEKIEFSKCNSFYNDRTCGSTSCNFCAFIGSIGAYCPAGINYCNARGLSCSYSNNATYDIIPPVITLTSPEDSMVYNQNDLYITGTSDELADWYYKDNLNERSNYKKFCLLTASCNKKINFDEGMNNITIKAEDNVGNAETLVRIFFVDSKIPKIYTTWPRNGFADGNFEVSFKEANPESLVLFYGNKNQTVDIASKCHPKNSKTYCNIFVSLNEFDGQQINYWFKLTDIAGNFAKTKSVELDVDTTAPVINNLETFWNYQNGSRHVYFNMSITENNLDEVSYSYIDSRGELREKLLCSDLKNGFCAVKKGFTRGNYDLTINTIDEAGNILAVPINFEVKY